MAGQYKTLVSATDNGTRLEALRALRRKVAKTIDGTSSGRDVASLSKQLREILAEIEEIQKGTDDEKKDIKNVLEIVRVRHQKKEA